MMRELKLLFFSGRCVKFVLSLVDTASKGDWLTATEEAYDKFHQQHLLQKRAEEEIREALHNALTPKGKEAKGPASAKKEKAKDECPKEEATPEAKALPVKELGPSRKGKKDKSSKS